MPMVKGYLRVMGRHGHADQDLPPGHEHGDQDLPWSGAHPGHGLPAGLDDLDPGYGIPLPPPGVWPPSTIDHPWTPIHDGGHPGHDLPGAPARPGGGPVTPPVRPGGGPVTPPVHPGGGPVPPESSTKPPVEPGTIWPPVGNNVDGKFWVIAGIPGVGWRYVAVDLSLRADAGLPPEAPTTPDQTLPPTATPKT